jgi:signal transduction histidine kinase
MPTDAATSSGFRRPSRAAIEWWVLTTLLVALVVGLASGGGPGVAHPISRLNAAVHDLALRVWVRPPRDDVVVVAIDDDSLAQVGRWPWRRAVTAALLERLQAQAPRAIGIDLLFTEPAIDDDRLIAATAAGPAPVVLPVARQVEPDGRELPLLPLAELGALRPLGHVEFVVDSDGTIRGLYRSEAGFLSMAHRLAFPSAPAPPTAVSLANAVRDGGWRRDDYLRLAALGAPPRQVSAAAVLRGELAPDALRDRVVLVGATARGLGDTHSTTLLPADAPVPGVTLHAAAVDALLADRLLREVPLVLRATLGALLVAAVMAILYVTEPRTGLVCVAGALAATAAGAVALAGAGQWWPPGAPLVGLALAFPLWSWRRLAAASAGLIEQASRLEADASPVPAQRGPIEPISRRLQRLERAAERIRDLNHGLATALDTLQAAQREREQTLRFLSHDLRTPHLSILGLLQARGGGPLDAESARAVERQSQRALALTDGFMQLARAESQPIRAEAQDLVDLATEAADACWDRARARGVTLVTPAASEPGAPCRCDAQLLRRAFVNLLDNAIRFSPAGARVELAIEPAEHGWRIVVSDRGPGIPPGDRERVFEPWWRGTQADPDGGAGLGLAFVATVTERHGGRVRATERPDGSGARIELWLPDEPLDAGSG